MSQTRDISIKKIHWKNRRGDNFLWMRKKCMCTFSHRDFTWLSVSCWQLFNCSIHWSSSFNDAFSSIVQIYVWSLRIARTLSTCNKSKASPSRKLNHSVLLEKLLNTNIPIQHTLTKWPIASTDGDVTLNSCVLHYL